MGEIVRRTVLFLATIAQFGVAIAMIIFVRRLSDVGLNNDTQEFEEMSCSLNAGTTDDADTEGLKDESLCVLAYAGASLTLFAMFVLSVLLVRLLCSAIGRPLHEWLLVRVPHYIVYCCAIISAQHNV